MASTLKHRKVLIIVLEAGEDLAIHGKPRSIVLLPDESGWWLKFIDASGQIDSYDIPYASYNEALWAAKAAAEFGID